jgi:hypothetical protein
MIIERIAFDPMLNASSNSRHQTPGRNNVSQHKLLPCRHHDLGVRKPIGAIDGANAVCVLGMQIRHQHDVVILGPTALLSFPLSTARVAVQSGADQYRQQAVLFDSGNGVSALESTKGRGRTHAAKPRPTGEHCAANECETAATSAGEYSP